MTIWLWVGFLLLVVALLALDLGVLNRQRHVMGVRESLGWTAFWIALALLFNGAIYFMYTHHWLGIGQEVGHELSGGDAALQFFVGYLLEKSLSLDNIFVIAMVFAYFGVSALYQHRVLFWGIFGALVMRGAMILAGAALIEHFSWMLYVFGALLILTAIKMLVVRDDNLEPEKNPVVRLVRRLVPMTRQFHEDRFFVREAGRLMGTPMLVVVLVIESMDLLFAIDSIPAIFAVTRDPFLVFTSNVFAILGLRALYFALAAMMGRFRHLKSSLVFVLAFIGVKMLLEHHYPLPLGAALGVVVGILAVGVAASLLMPGPDSAAIASPLPELEDRRPVDQR